MSSSAEDDRSIVPGATRPVGQAALPTCHRICAAGFTAAIVAEIGGSLAAFHSGPIDGVERRDWLRAADDDASLRSRSPLAMASFPLVPWCNRIRDGRFEWRGHAVAMAPNVTGSPHTIHGIAWQRDWHVEHHGESSVELSIDVAASAQWPFAFRAEQRYALDADGLSIDLAMINTGTEPMPAGIGHHPYFAHRREGVGTRVTASVAAIWLSNAETMPVELSDRHPSLAQLRSGMRLADFALDNNYTGYARRARIDWPDGSALDIAASEPQDFLVLYTPADQDIFVLEAVTNCTDWVNIERTSQAGEGTACVGGTALAPGQRLSATTWFRPLPRGTC